LSSNAVSPDAWLDKHAQDIAHDTAELVKLHTESFPAPLIEEAALQDKVASRLENLASLSTNGSRTWEESTHAYLRGTTGKAAR
jgi:hypothetical protein